MHVLVDLSHIGVGICMFAQHTGNSYDVVGLCG